MLETAISMLAGIIGGIVSFMIMLQAAYIDTVNDQYNMSHSWQYQVYCQHCEYNYITLTPKLSYIVTLLLPIHYLLSNIG